MIFKKIYYDDNYFIVSYNKNNHIKIYINNNKIIFEKINHIDTFNLEEIYDTYLLSEFPFEFVKKHQVYELDFLPLLNSKIYFYLLNEKLYCSIKIDNNIVADYYVKTRIDKIKICIKNIGENISLLTYVEDIEMYSNNNNIIVLLSVNKLIEIKKLAKKYNWYIDILS